MEVVVPNRHKGLIQRKKMLLEEVVHGRRDSRNGEIERNGITKLNLTPYITS